MKQMRLQIFTLVVAFLVVVSGCTRPAATPTLDARPETLPTLTPTPTPLPVQTSPLPVQTSPLPAPDKQSPGQVAIPAAAEAIVYWAVNDLAERLGASRETVRVIEVQSVEWRDSSLGCPEPGMVYAQVITPGYLIVLEAGEAQYEYHAGRDGDAAIFCPDGQKPVPDAAQ